MRLQHLLDIMGQRHSCAGITSGYIEYPKICMALVIIVSLPREIWNHLHILWKKLVLF